MLACMRACPNLLQLGNDAVLAPEAEDRTSARLSRPGHALAEGLFFSIGIGLEETGDSRSMPGGIVEVKSSKSSLFYAVKNLIYLYIRIFSPTLLIDSYFKNPFK